MKEFIKDVAITVGIILGIILAIYLLFGFVSWIWTDPFNIISDGFVS